MRIFLTGATGALGRRVVPLLLDAGHQVTGVARSPEKRQLLERQGARAVQLDLFDVRAVRPAVKDADTVVNLATAVPPGIRAFLPWPWHEMARIRRYVSRNLVDAALAGGAVRRIVQESFAPIYADQGDRWIDESSPVRPARYNRTALDAEANAERFSRAGRAGVVLRFGLLYGPGDRMTLQMLELVRRGWFPLFGRPEGYTSWLHHQDAATAVVAALEVPAGIYNAAENEPMRRRDLANGIAKLLDVAPPRLLPGWATLLGGVVGETLARSLRVSNRKLRAGGGWAPRYSTILEGVAAILNQAET